ncbi:MAG: CsgG/HfaB family protein [Candidatus Neomarinimicrobiota bacterium]
MLPALLIGLCLPVSLFSQDLHSVAVLDLDARGISAVETASLTDRLRSELVKTGALTIVERGQMQQILTEQDFQLAGCTSDECAVEVGQLLGVTQMIAGSIGRIGATYLLDIRIIDVTTGAIMQTLTQNYRGEIDGLVDAIEEMAWTIAGGRPAAEIPLPAAEPEPQLEPQPPARTPAPAQAKEAPPERKGRGWLYVVAGVLIVGASALALSAGGNGTPAGDIPAPPDLPAVQ